MQYNENQVELLVGPGLKPAARAIISVSPPGSGIILDHGVTTVAEGQPSRISLERVPGSSMLRVSGQMAVGAPAISETAAVPNPTILYLNALREALARNGIFVGGNSLDIDDARVKPDYSQGDVLLEDRSPTLASVIDVCLKWSRNEYAETLLLAGACRRRSHRGAGLDVVTETLSKWGVAPELYVARDGSGLSRNDYLAPDALIGVLTRMWTRPAAHGAIPLGPAAVGVSGTLANRMKDTPAAEPRMGKDGIDVERAIAVRLRDDARQRAARVLVHGHRLPRADVADRRGDGRGTGPARQIPARAPRGVIEGASSDPLILLTYR